MEGLVRSSGAMRLTTGGTQSRLISLRPKLNTLGITPRINEHATLTNALPVDASEATNTLDSITSHSQTHLAAQTVYDLAAIDAQTAFILALIIKPVLSVSSLLMIVRIFMTWSPEIDATQAPWSYAFIPTEPILAATRKIVKPFNGLDVSPIVWVAILSFLSEILTGPQGILNLLQRKGI